MTSVLVTNDDGIESAGLHVLAAALERAGCDVLVVAPDRDRSGIGAAIGLVHADEHLDVKKVRIPGCPAVPAYAIDGPPGLCVCAGRLGAFGDPPDIVVSGVNPGCNTGRAILHSGTVGAALTAQSFGCSALAVSVDVGDEWHFDTAARIAVDVLPMLLAAPARSVLNLNVPSRAYADVLGIRWARLAAFGSVRAALVESGAGGLQFELRATGVRRAGRFRSGPRGRGLRRAHDDCRCRRSVADRARGWRRRLRVVGGRAGRERRARRDRRVRPRGARCVGTSIAAPPAPHRTRRPMSNAPSTGRALENLRDG